MKTITMKRYSEAFKLQVVSEYEGGQSIGLRGDLLHRGARNDV